MGSPQLIALLLTLGTLFTFFVTSVRRRHETKTVDDFLLYGRALGKKAYTSTFVATSISLATVLSFFLDFTGQFGLALWLSPAAYAIGCVGFLACLKPMERHGYLAKGTTLHAFLGHAFGSPALRRMTAIISMIGYLGIFVIEIHVGVSIFQVFSSAPGWDLLVAFALTGTIALYTYLGGFRAVVDTDVIQLRLILVGTIAAFLSVGYLQFVMPEQHDIATSAMLTPAPWLLPTPFIVVMLVGNIPFQMLRMDNWLRAAAVGDRKIAVTATRNSIIAAALSWVAFSVLGLLFYRIAPPTASRPTLALLQLLASSDSALVSYVAFPLIFAGFVAALVSTADSVFMPIVTAFLYDFRAYAALHDKDGWARASLDPDADAKLMRAGRRSVVVFVGIGAAIYIVLTRVLSFGFVDLLYVFFNQQLVMFPAVALAIRGLNSAPGTAALSRMRPAVITATTVAWFATWVVTIAGTQNDRLSILGQEVTGGDLVLYASAVGWITSIGLTILLAPRAVIEIARARAASKAQ